LNTDVVPTLLAHLGIEVPSSWGLDGRTVGVIPELAIKAGDEDVTLRWPGIATLQSTSSLKDWKKVPHARSPYVYHPSSDQAFFRLVP
jgi:hypothetical protein